MWEVRGEERVALGTPLCEGRRVCLFQPFFGCCLGDGCGIRLAASRAMAGDSPR